MRDRIFINVRTGEAPPVSALPHFLLLNALHRYRSLPSPTELQKMILLRLEIEELIRRKGLHG